MIQLIKESADAAEAKAKLLARPWQSGLVGDMLSRTDLDLNMARPEGLPENLGLRKDGYYLSDLQADAILRMSLRNLTGLDQDTILKSSTTSSSKSKPTSAIRAAAKSTRSAATSPTKT